MTDPGDELLVGALLSEQIPRVTFKSVLVKVASRCNLSCDYCYMYEHADQSWKSQPRFMNPLDEAALIDRVGEYTSARGLTSFLVIFHGGEPLLAGAEKLADLANRIRAGTPGVRIDVGLQTNGVLLDERALQVLAESDVSISLSLDGPPEVHDRHRPTKAGNPTHSRVMSALHLLQAHPQVFAGVIAVIDPETNPSSIVRWFADLGVPALDLLLPDANYGDLPPGRDSDPDLYTRWLLAAFDAWFDTAPNMPIRTFDAVLRAVAGLGSGTDAFGLGEVNLLCVETDGSYHDLDVLKTTFEGRTALQGHVARDPIMAMETVPTMQEHAQLLTIAGLSATCQSCPELHSCGGGSVPHRYMPTDTGPSWSNPSVYCRELLALFTHARHRLGQQLLDDRETSGRGRLTSPGDWNEIEGASGLEHGTAHLFRAWANGQTEALQEQCQSLLSEDEPDARDAAAELLALPRDVLGRVATRASTQLLLQIGRDRQAGAFVRDSGGGQVRLNSGSWTSVAEQAALEPRRHPAIHRDDALLRLPFAEPIVFLDPNDPHLDAHRAGTTRALSIIEQYSQGLADELTLLCSDIQFIRDTSAHPDKSVSFSDDAVPGALFVSPPRHWDDEAVFDVADSLIHEYRHQKLYLIDTQASLVDRDWPLVHSPWREEPRPPSGVLHAVFVFVELLDYWRWVYEVGPGHLRERSSRDIDVISSRLAQGFQTLNSCDLSPSGRSLAEWLAQRSAL